MRITGGTYKGRTVKCPKGEIRPAMDRMRESLFSILGNLSGSSFLDLFSGSGLVGLEAASRGAEPVVLVEKDPGKKRVIRENMEIAKEDIKLYLMPVQRFLRQFKTDYDIVYLDPPFPFGQKVKMVIEVSQRKIVKPGGLIIIHYPEEDVWPEKVDDLELIDKRKYGRSILLFFKKPE
ncbi:MAG: 16S rRNA (guanine(966)-N(2))-methyltransferase RsmD [Spirochaetales bacterium]|nr:16S rRNA (guanine(966)-N(2))-methyltransferase RsmD [Spirochaetales bacterium]